MARAQVRVRDADDTDLAMLAEWWDELRISGVRSGPFAPPPLDSKLRERIQALHRDGRHRVLVVECDGTPAGLAVLSIERVSPLNDAQAVQIGFLHVRQDCRRKGAGRALVKAAADFADELGTTYVTVAALPQAKDTNRFFARLGFSPLVMRRAVTTGTLRRRLASPALPGLVARRRLTGRRGLQQRAV